MNFAIKGLDHVVLRVTDLDRSIGFYRDVLGCREVRREESIGLYQYRAGAHIIDLVPVDSELGRMGGAAAGAEARNLDHFCIRIDPFEADGLREHLHGHGIDMGEVKSRYGAEGQGPSVYITDPDGNVVELKGPAFDT